MQGIKVDATIAIYRGDKFWWLERVTKRKVDSQEENTSLVRTVIQTHEGEQPVE